MKLSDRLSAHRSRRLIAGIGGAVLLSLGAGACGLPGTAGIVEAAPPPPPAQSPPVNVPAGPSTYGPSSLALPTYNGPKRITSPTTISDVTINGELEILAPVTMTNVNMNCTTGWACIYVHDAGRLTISNFRIDGGGTRSSQNSGGLIGSNITASNGEITGVENGVDAWQNVLVQDTYIHGLQYMFRDPNNPGHPDGVQLNGGNSNITLRRLRIEGVLEDTSAMMIATTYGPSSNIRVEDCTLSGAGVLMYLETRKTGAPLQVSITGTTFNKPGYRDMYVWNTIPGNVSLTQSGNTTDGRPATF